MVYRYIIMPLCGPTCKMVLARIQFRLNSKLDPSVAKVTKHLPYVWEYHMWHKWSLSKSPYYVLRQHILSLCWERWHRQGWEVQNCRNNTVVIIERPQIPCLEAILNPFCPGCRWSLYNLGGESIWPTLFNIILFKERINNSLEKKLGRYLENWPRHCSFCRRRNFLKIFENFIFQTWNHRDSAIS